MSLGGKGFGHGLGQIGITHPAGIFTPADPPAPTTGTAVDWLVNFSGTVGATVTATILNASVIGTLPGSWSEISPGDPHTFLADPAGLTRFRPLVVNGTAYSAPTKLLKFDFDYAQAHSNVDYNGWSRAFSPIIPAQTITMLVQFNGVAASANSDTLVLYYDGGAYLVPQFNTANHTFYPHSDGTLGHAITLTPGHWYAVTLRINPDTTFGEMVVVDNDDGSFVGCSHNYPTAATEMNLLILQDYLQIPDSGNTLVAYLAGKTGGTFPLEPLTVPTPSPSASKSAEEQITVTLSTAAITWKIERATDGGSYSTLEEDYDQYLGGNYVDDTVTNGHSYVYRVTAKIGDFSASAFTDSVAMEAADASELWDTFTGTNGDLLDGRTPSPLAPGANWAVTAGTAANFTIQDDRARLSFPTGGVYNELEIDTGASDGVVTYTVFWSPGVQTYFLFRKSSATNRWYLLVNNEGLLLVKTVAGVDTVIDSAAGSIADLTDHSVTVTFSGNAISATCEGFSVEATDSHNATATKICLSASSGSDGQVIEYDDVHFIPE